MYSTYNCTNDWLPYYSVIHIFVCFSLYWIAIKGSGFQSLFALFIIANYSDDVTLFAKIVETYIILKFWNIPYPQSYLWSLAIILAISLPFMWLFMTKQLRPMIERTEHLQFWRYLWIIPVSFYIIFRISLYPSYLTPAIQIEEQIVFLHSIWTFVTFISFYMVLRTLSEMFTSSSLQEKIHIRNIQLAMQKEQYTALQHTIEETRRARHDLRHHLLVIKEYVTCRNSAGITNYLHNYLETLAPADEVPTCENYAIDAIVQHYVVLARKKAIQVTLSLNIPAQLPISEIDLCIVLGNLLENAVEACARQTSATPFIHVKVNLSDKNPLIIIVKNSFTHEIGLSGDTFLSSKQNGAGIGITSVRNISEKYHGTAKFTYEDGIFQVALFFNPQFDTILTRVK